MRRFLVLLISTVLALTSAVGPAAAVTDGVPTGDNYSYVGLAVFYDAAGAPTHRCSGTMVSTYVFLTAGHCTAGTTSAQVWFSPEVTTADGYPYTGGITGTPITYPGYTGSIPNTGDLGVIILDSAPSVGSAALASPGTLDSLATQRGRQDVTFTVVGYGLQEVKPTVMADRLRMMATVQLVNLRSALTDGFNIHHTNAPGTGGGTCFGDSGGPVFDATGALVAVTSFGLNANCVGAGFAFRVDTTDAYNWITSQIAQYG